MTADAPRGAPPAAGGVQVDRDNPWPGLPSFREQDQEFFRGREAETETLRRLVMREATRATVLFGRSGLGKTSLLQAGLFPRLRSQGVLPVPLRLVYESGERAASETGGGEGGRGLVAQVREALGAAAAAAGVEAPALPPGETLWESLHRAGANFWSASNRIVVPLLVFDQFEEIFTLGRADPASREELLAELADLVEGRPPAAVRERLDADPALATAFEADRHDYKILLSLRQDFLADLDRWRARMRSLGASRLALLPMNGEAALRVVIEPGGHLIEPEVAERLVRFVAGAARQPGEVGAQAPLGELEVDPTLLSLICRELNNRRRERGDARISFDLLSGSWREILTGFYDSSLLGLAPAVRTFVEDRLLTRSGYRDSVAWDNALAVPGVGAADLLTLRDRRLLHFEERHGVAWVELTHDVLTEVIGESREVRHQREARLAAEAALREADERERQAREREDEARRQERRTMRLLVRSRRLTVVLTAVLLLAVVLGGLVLRLWRRSEAAERRAERALFDSAGNLIEKGRGAQALAYLASILRSNPDDANARNRALDLLLHDNWPLPVLVLRPERGAGLGRLGQAVRRERDAGAAPPDEEPRPERGASVAELSPDGGRLLTAGADGTVRLWRLPGGASLGVMPVGEGLLSAAFSPGGDRILTASRDAAPGAGGGILRLWDGRTGTPVGRGAKVDCRVLFDAAWSPRGDRILARCAGGLQLWDAARLVPRIRLPVPPRPGEPAAAARPPAAAFSPDGQRLLAPGAGGGLAWTDLRTGAAAGQLPLAAAGGPMAAIGAIGPIAAVGLNDRGDLLVTVDLANNVRVLNLATRQAVTLEHKARVIAAEMSPDDRTLATVAADRAVRLWSLAAPTAPARTLQHDRDVTAARFSPDSRWLLTASRDGAARVWNVRLGELAEQPLLHAAPVTAIGWSRDSQRVVTAADDGTVKLWDLRPDHWGRPHELPGPARSAAFTPGGRKVVVLTEGTAETAETAETAGTRAAVEPGAGLGGWLWDLAADAGTRLAPAGAPLAAAAVLPDGRTVTVAHDSVRRTYQVFDGRSGRPLGPAIPHSEARDAQVTLSADGSRLVEKGPFGRRITVWETRTGRQIPARWETGADVRGGRVSPDGRLLVAWSPAGAQLWDLATGARTAEIALPGVHHAQFAAQGRYVVIVSADNALGVFAAPDGRRVGRPLRPEGIPRTVEVSRDGTRILTNADDGDATVSEGGRALCQLHVAALSDPGSPAAAPFAATLSADGRILLTRSPEGLAQVWDVASCQPLTAPLWQPPPSQVAAAAFNADGTLILTLDTDRVARVWDLPATRAADSGLLAELAEAAGGYAVDATGVAVALPDQVARLAALRARAARPASEPSLALQVARWFLAEPAARTLSPFSAVRARAAGAVAPAAAPGGEALQDRR